jgi:hypothetical protein
MPNEPYRIGIPSESELGRLLDRVGDKPILLERNGKHYHLIPEPEADLWTGYDPEKARIVLKQMAGSWAEIDTDKLITELTRVRDEGSRPDTRP